LDYIFLYKYLRKRNDCKLSLTIDFDAIDLGKIAD